MFKSLAQAWNRFFSVIDKIFAAAENVAAVAEAKSRVFRIEGEGECEEALRLVQSKQQQPLLPAP